MLWVTAMGRVLKAVHQGINWAECMTGSLIPVGTKIPTKDYSFFKQTFLGAPPYSSLHRIMKWKPPSNPNHTGWVIPTTHAFLSSIPVLSACDLLEIHKQHLWTKTACCSALLHYLVQYGSDLIWDTGQHWQNNMPLAMWLHYSAGYVTWDRTWSHYKLLCGKV